MSRHGSDCVSLFAFHFVLVLMLYNLHEVHAITCSPPDNIPSSTTTEPQFTNLTSFDIGAYITWGCENGFMIDGPADAIVTVCDVDGSWKGTPPTCTARSCPTPPSPPFSSIESAVEQPFVVDSVVNYKCGDDYDMIGDPITTCTIDGTWSNEPPVCQRKCEHDYYIRYLNHTCFRRRGKKNWNDANDLCRGNSETLSVIQNEETQAFLEANLPSGNNAPDRWIGAREGLDWMWDSSSEYISRMFLDPIATDAAGSCLALQVGASGEFNGWTALSCDGPVEGFICEFNSTCSEAKLDDGRNVTQDYRGRCYEFRSGTNRTWQEGKDACIDQGGYLAEPMDQDRNRFLSVEASKFRQESQWWLGGRDNNTDTRSWFWVDNTRVDYFNWDENEPDDNEACVRLDRSETYRWDSRGCTKNENTLCQAGYEACGDPGQPINGERAPTGETTFLSGATVDFSCHAGYALNGPATITCQTNGQWDVSRPSCQAVSCPELHPNVAFSCNATITSTKYRGVVTYHCCHDYILNNPPTSTCRSDGTWSAPNFTCKAIPACISNPCSNGGTCEGTEGGNYLCTCPRGFTGDNCEDVATTSAIVSTDRSTSHEVPYTMSGSSTTDGGPAAAAPVAAIVSSTMAFFFLIVIVVLGLVFFKRRSGRTPSKVGEVAEMEDYATVDNLYEIKVPKTPADLSVSQMHLIGNGGAMSQGNVDEKLDEDDYDLVGGTVPPVTDVPHANGSLQDNTLYHTLEGPISEHIDGRRPEGPLHSVVQEDTGGADDGETYETFETVLEDSAGSKPVEGRRAEEGYTALQQTRASVSSKAYTAISPSDKAPVGQYIDVIPDEYSEIGARDARIHNPSKNTEEENAYELEGQGEMIDNELYASSSPRVSRALGDCPNSVGEEVDDALYENTEYHSEPADMTVNELYKSTDEL